MMRTLVAFFFSLLIITGCGQDKKNDQIVKIKTPYGEMVAVLYDETPEHKKNFIKLVEEHYYDSLLFHRIVKGFMIQGGDSSSRHAAPGVRLGMGGKKY